MASIIVIGAGLSGLAAACHLRGAGHEVTVLEATDTIGGLAGRGGRDGFRFDTGPTVLTLPSLIDDTLRAVGSSLDQRLSLHRVEPAYRGHFADGSTLDVHTDPDTMAEEITRVCGAEEAERYRRHVAWLHTLYELEFRRFIDVDFSSPLDLARSPAALARLAALGGFDRLDRVVARRFTDVRLRRLLTFQALYVGLSPRQALALYAVVTYLDSVAGVHHPRGGIHEVPRALATAFTDAGGTVHRGTRVTGLLGVATGRVRGVTVDDGSPAGHRLAADVVVCSSDLARAWSDWLPNRRPPRVVRRGRHAPSAVVWHVGARGAVSADTRHHNVHFGHEWDASFDDLLVSGRLMRDPSRLVTVPGVSDPGDSPAGTTSLYVLEPVPNLHGTVDWAAERSRFRDRLHGFLAGAGYPSDVVVEELVTPQDWAARGLSAGTPFSYAHTFGQSGPFRPALRPPRLPGLVFTGAGNRPGVGVPMVIISGRLAAEQVRGQLPRSRR